MPFRKIPSTSHSGRDTRALRQAVMFCCRNKDTNSLRTIIFVIVAVIIVVMAVSVQNIRRQNDHRLRDQMGKLTPFGVD